MKYHYKTIPSPVGELKLVASDKGLAAVMFENGKHDKTPLGELVEAPRHPTLVAAEKQLNDYFAGKRTTFTVPLDPTGTVFQQKVWEALRTIPFGETRSYGAIARQVGNEKAMRAVGAANGQNPIAIIVPCHRVIGANGDLTGFGGGIPRKETLLALEKKRG